MNTPLVTVICVCYNHAQYVIEALNSVAGQTYNNIELIVIDDGSTDGSPKIVKQWIASHPVTVLLLNGTNLGYCKTFNKAFKLAKGEFIIDFAADDVMMPDKIRSQVDFFSKLDRTYGVIFSDAEYIDEKGIYIRDHFKYLIGKGLLKSLPQGNVYADVLDKYFIPAPTMLSRVEVYRELGGYDEDLAYEDFDFWIRSSRYFKYGFQNEKLMRIRRTAKSMSSGWYTRNDPQLLSTYQICKKARKLNRDERDWQAWVKRVRYELRQSVFSENHTEAKLFLQLLREDSQQNWQDQCIYWIDSFKLPLAILRKWYHQIWFHSFK